MPFAGQDALTSHACAATLAGDRDLCRDNLRLDRGCQPFCLRKAKPEIAQTGLLIAFDACDLDLRRLPGLQLRHQFDPPHQFHHQLTLVP